MVQCFILYIDFWKQPPTIHACSLTLSFFFMIDSDWAQEIPEKRLVAVFSISNEIQPVHFSYFKHIRYMLFISNIDTLVIHLFYYYYFTLEGI